MEVAHVLGELGPGQPGQGRPGQRNRARRRAAATIVALLVAAPATSCLGDGVHLADDGVYYTAGARGALACTYGPVPDAPAEAETAALERAGRSLEVATALRQAAPGSGGRYLRVEDAAGFASEGCENWIPASMLNPVIEGADGVPAGMYRVGHDLAPGTYHSAGGPGCEWFVLADATTDAEILARGGGSGPSTLEVHDADTYVLIDGCAAFGLVSPADPAADPVHRGAEHGDQK